jgi:hypothetical protein
VVELLLGRNFAAMALETLFSVLSVKQGSSEVTGVTGGVIYCIPRQRLDSPDLRAVCAESD